MSRSLILIILAFSLYSCIYGQTDDKPTCPDITITGPTGVVRPREIATYTATVNAHGTPLDLKYVWSVSAGKIRRGQGTATIEVEQPEIQSITVTLDILGLPPGCSNTMSETEIGDPAPQATKLDQFSGAVSKMIESGFREIAAQMVRQPNSQLYVVVGYSKNDGDRSARAKTRQITSRFIKSGLDKMQISYVISLATHDIMEFWLVPPGAQPPRCAECDELQKTSRSPTCPSISIVGPSGIVRPGEVATFTAQVDTKGLDLTYKWSVSSGRIVREPRGLAFRSHPCQIWIRAL